MSEVRGGVQKIRAKEFGRGVATWLIERRDHAEPRPAVAARAEDVSEKRGGFLFGGKEAKGVTTYPAVAVDGGRHGPGNRQAAAESQGLPVGHELRRNFTFKASLLANGILF